MNNVKNIFSIKDLENLSGIKAHTIRIWEKRYNALEPMRTDSNIRYYDITNLQKLLNIVLLHDYGYKISKISKLSETEIPALVKQITTDKTAKNHAINSFKMAMMNFDQSLFFKTYDSLLSEKSFREVFYEVFIPLMNEIGLLWQTNTISPSHEHFLTNLFKQKIQVNTEKVQILEPTRDDKVFVLFLPMNEIHEIGLMYLNYEVLLQGYRCIYLGENIPVDSLKDISSFFNNIIYVSYLTVEPLQENIDQYILDFEKEILTDNKDELYLIGRMTQFINRDKLPEKVSIYQSIEELTKKIQ
ncbi:MerR family transcriptional regulator [Flavobacterium sp.]|jgi:DNA-binding transcriptional MerR regulator|uniref:MerR family transcriptional regulator n=1 Tax=Flavobacterium sp. TaxID=239 RepID=UPI002A80A88C|nr:MerR family transcriptional regulator [Flavobacterium sp.]